MGIRDLLVISGNSIFYLLNGDYRVLSFWVTTVVRIAAVVRRARYDVQVQPFHMSRTMYTRNPVPVMSYVALTLNAIQNS